MTVTSKPKALNQSPRFTAFVRERDHALEEILDKYLRAQDRLVVFLRMRVSEIASHMGLRAVDIAHQKQTLTVFDKRISPLFDLCAAESLQLMKDLRRISFTLANAGESEAIARALGKPCKVSIPKDKLQRLHWRDTPSGGSLEARVHLAYSRLKRDVLDAYQLSLTLEDDAEGTIARIKRAFPSSRKLVRPKNALRSLKESDDQTKLDRYRLGRAGLSSGVIDDETWNDIVDDYKSEYLPADIYRRGPSDKTIYFSVDESGSVDMTERYDWEVEKEMTEDFVSSVRAGEIDAANENGISDFMWLAIIDKRTDDCCADRDGLSSKEIEDKLESGDIDSDECDAITPPAHFNCRCRPVPMSDDLPEESPPDFGSFDDWLTEQGNEAAA